MTFVGPYRDETSVGSGAVLRWLRLTACWVGLWLLGISAAWSAASEDAVTTVATLHAGLIAAAAHQQDPFEQRTAALLPLITVTHDLDYIGQITIRRQWSQLTPAQQSDFKLAFRNLAVATYLARFGGLQDARFQISSDEAVTQGRHHVSATLRTAVADSVKLVYVLQQTEDDHWKIINVVANDVSDLALKRSEYQRILRDSNFAGLLDELNEQTRRLAVP